ncbi:MAG: recombination protein RecR [Thermodesulfobacteriota bacterium]|jgi:recombination protein RecR|nr:recombination protein RecR [Thermodesulfobacteriota bacterium]
MINPLNSLITALKQLPGVGEKTALRYAFHILNANPDDIRELIGSIKRVREELRLCSSCFNLTDIDPCVICSDPKRDSGRLCVVETPLDLMSVEKSGRFKGVYHVIHGLLSPLDAIGPDDIRIKDLIDRVESGDIEEIILALNPTIEGEATASYLAQKVRSKNVKVSRIAYGIPIGGSLEYADPLTMSRALENRTEI